MEVDKADKKDSQTGPLEPRVKRPSERVSKLDVMLFVLRRNLRIIIGLILIIAIGSWIYYASINPRKPKTVGSWSNTILPIADIDSPPTRPGEFIDPLIDSEPEVRSMKLEHFLSSATIDELIEDALDLRLQWQNNEMPVAYILVQRRAKIARRLLEMEIDETQRTFAYNEYIESVATLDGLNCEGKMGAPGIRDALKEIAEKFSDYPDPVIGSKASLAFLLEHAHDYLKTNDTQKMLAFSDQFKIHADKILRDPVTTFQLIKLVVEISKKSNFHDDLKQCGIEMLDRLEQSTDSEILKIAGEFREQVYFAKMELGSLADRLQSDTDLARNDVQEFFESLETNPNSRVEIYQIAVDSILEYKRLNMTADATALTNWLEQINSQNENETAKEKITKAVAALRE